jgi:hypothetical protein
MQITNYQMRNVLACYGKKLSRMRTPDRLAVGQPGMIVEQLAISPETTRKATMEKISQQLFEKIADVVALQPGQEGPQGPPSDAGIDSGTSKQSAAVEPLAFSLAESSYPERAADPAAIQSAAWIRRSEQSTERTISRKADPWI